MRPLDAVDALGLAARLCADHRSEILRTHPDLNAWALERVNLPGAQWAMEANGVVVAIGGVVDQGDTAYLWFAGAAGWSMHGRHLIRAFRAIKESGAFSRFRCEVYADNPKAARFAERLGFSRGQPDGSLVPYEMGVGPC